VAAYPSWPRCQSAGLDPPIVHPTAFAGPRAIPRSAHFPLPPNLRGRANPPMPPNLRVRSVVRLAPTDIAEGGVKTMNNAIRDFTELLD